MTDDSSCQSKIKELEFELACSHDAYGKLMDINLGYFEKVTELQQKLDAIEEWFMDCPLILVKAKLGDNNSSHTTEIETEVLDE